MRWDKYLIACVIVGLLAAIAFGQPAITGPDDIVPIGRSVWLEVNGVAKGELQAGSIDVFPKGYDVDLRTLQDLSGTILIWFEANEANALNQYDILVLAPYIEDGTAKLKRLEWTIKTGEAPKPPTPIPPTPPDDVLARLNAALATVIDPNKVATANKLASIYETSVRSAKTKEELAVAVMIGGALVLGDKATAWQPVTKIVTDTLKTCTDLATCKTVLTTISGGLRALGPPPQPAPTDIQSAILLLESGTATQDQAILIEKIRAKKLPIWILDPDAENETGKPSPWVAAGTEAAKAKGLSLPVVIGVGETGDVLAIDAAPKTAVAVESLLKKWGLKK